MMHEHVLTLRQPCDGDLVHVYYSGRQACVLSPLPPPTSVCRCAALFVLLLAVVEHTDRHNNFYAKFNTRQSVGDILMHCWTIPAHREAWKRFAALQGGRGPYQRFANMLINDATYLLDDALKNVQVGGSIAGVQR